ncbi:MAG: hypothetical protein J0I20_21955 [Chloroflexi bacterium]|nr:hypothetical protein [Chloroflexota bacterium]OJW05373.1 MAG: hypothetical protein BGO39_33800 [Chloroflexi bacterium 54-19]
MKSFLKRNGLALAMFGLFFLIMIGQIVAGFSTNNDDLKEHGLPQESIGGYLVSGHFIEAVFENWESEFLQMGCYVLFTSFLKQKGAADSKPLEGEAEEDEDPREKKDEPHVPWPVKKGGLVLKLYENSLTITLFTLFIISFLLHAYGGSMQYCTEQQEHGEQCVGFLGFLGTSQFWFQSFQNWQSEFLSVGALVVLTIFLRQRGSTESKTVATPHYLTGNES